LPERNAETKKEEKKGERNAEEGSLLSLEDWFPILISETKPVVFKFNSRSGTFSSRCQFFRGVLQFHRELKVSKEKGKKIEKGERKNAVNGIFLCPKTSLLPPASVVASFSVHGFETVLAESPLFRRWVLYIQSEYQLQAVRHGGARSSISSNKLVKINSLTFKIHIWNVLPANAYSYLKCKNLPFLHILWMFALSIWVVYHMACK